MNSITKARETTKTKPIQFQSGTQSFSFISDSISKDENQKEMKIAIPIKMKVSIRKIVCLEGLSQDDKHL